MKKRFPVVDYVVRWNSVHRQHQFGLWAISHFGKNESVVHEYIKADVARLRVAGDTLNPNQRPDFERGIEAHASVLTENIPKALKDTRNSVNQNALLLYLAAFESALKDIHKAILQNHPDLIKQDRQVHLGRLAAKGYPAVLAEEIEREICSLDRLSLERRAEHFDKRLGISSTSEEGYLQNVMGVIATRNVILHEDPSLEVSDSTADQAGINCLCLGILMLSNAEQKYPELNERTLKSG